MRRNLKDGLARGALLGCSWPPSAFNPKSALPGYVHLWSSSGKEAPPPPKSGNIGILRSSAFVLGQSILLHAVVEKSRFLARLLPGCMAKFTSVPSPTVNLAKQGQRNSWQCA